MEKPITRIGKLAISEIKQPQTHDQFVFKAFKVDY